MDYAATKEMQTVLSTSTPCEDSGSRTRITALPLSGKVQEVYDCYWLKQLTMMNTKQGILNVDSRRGVLSKLILSYGEILNHVN